MSGTTNDNFPRQGPFQRLQRLIESLEQFAHDLLAPPIWRVLLTFVSFVTTTYGLMLLYNTLSGGDHHTLGWLRIVIPVSIGGGLHATIFFLLRRWAATRRTRYFAGAVPLQVLAILASFGTHWLGMLGGDTTLEGFQKAIDDAQRGIGIYAASYAIIQTETAALSAHSDTEAQVEATGAGNSCGEVAGAGRGPRYDLRMADKATYDAFAAEVRDRKAELDQFVERAGAITAGSADQAMAHLVTLRNLTNEAKAHFEADPLLGEIRKVAEARIVTGKGPITIAPAQRGRSGAATFSCYDVELEHRLQAVVGAIDHLRTLPEVYVPDYRNPEVGFPFALWRLYQMLGSWDVAIPSRHSLTTDRIHTLHGRDVPQQPEAHWRDVTPLAVASGIEALLALLFFIGRAPFAPQPGLRELADVLERDETAVFDRVWQALGGSADPQAVRRTLDAYAKFERNHVLIFVPLYGDNDDMRVLHSLMEMLVFAHMARRIHTGRGLLSSLYRAGWHPDRKARLAGQAVRIYRMTMHEHLAFTLDALKRRPPDDGPAEAPHEPYHPGPQGDGPIEVNENECTTESPATGEEAA